MNGKNLLHRILYGILLCTSVLLGGCKTTAIDSTGIGERNQYLCGQLDSTIRSLDRELTASNDELRECLERSHDIEEGAGRLKYLISSYFSVVKRIQNANNQALAELELLEKVRDTVIPYSSDTDSVISDVDNIRKNSQN